MRQLMGSSRKGARGRKLARLSSPSAAAVGAGGGTAGSALLWALVRALSNPAPPAVPTPPDERPVVADDGAHDDDAEREGEDAVRQALRKVHRVTGCALS